MILLMSILACVHADLGGIPRREQLWDVGVLVATGDRQLEAAYELHTEPIGADRWRVSTIRTTGSWSDGGEPSKFDSAAPVSTDPWPLTLQHLVASVPAEVIVENGRPVALADPEAWTDAARGAVYAAEVPTDAFASAEALLDPSGLVADLGRTFPGTPPLDGAPWGRTERIAGLDVQRVEQCGQEDAERSREQWSCTGTVETAEGAGARLFEVTTFTRLEADRRGLVWMESGYSGTLVTMAPDGRGVVDRPIAGLRRIERREVAP